MKTNSILILILISLFFVSCTITKFSEDLKNFESCSANVEPIGPCIVDKVGYEFDTATDTCSEVIVQGCAIESPFESLVECQAACYTSEQNKDKSIKSIIDKKIQEREDSKNE